MKNLAEILKDVQDGIFDLPTGTGRINGDIAITINKNSVVQLIAKLGDDLIAHETQVRDNLKKDLEALQDGHEIP